MDANKQCGQSDRDRKLPIYSVETSENKIALSFDAAWGAEDFQNIMDVLDAHDVKVTFLDRRLG